MYKYECEPCGFYTVNKTDYNRHLTRPKHINIQNILNDDNWSCHCGKVYLHQSSYSRHKKKCTKEKKSETTTNPSITETLCLEVIKTNKEFCKEMMTQQNQIVSKVVDNVSHNNSHNTNNNSHNTNTNSHNKVFNLQFFLNEQCKDAISINEFVNNIKVSIADLEETGRLGYVDGISKIIIDNLKKLETHKRPIHCSDVKRETFYIKDDDKWLKENENHPIIKKFVRIIAQKNIEQLCEWIKLYPDCIQSDSRKNNMYHKITDSSMSGETEDEQIRNLHKIIKNIANQVIIDKMND